jgi:hypothetical protein
VYVRRETAVIMMKILGAAVQSVVARDWCTPGLRYLQCHKINCKS